MTQGPIASQKNRSRYLSNHSQGGFSLFELVVFIISVAIIYAYAANRFAEFPGQAERANFLAVSTQLQSAISLEMMFGAGMNRQSMATALEGANPMDLLLEPPVNYLGAFDIVDQARLERRTWYFDRGTRELVYLVNDTEGVFLEINGVAIPTDEIRFRIAVDMREIDVTTGLPVTVAESRDIEVPESNRQSEIYGLLLRSTIPYIWATGEEDDLIIVATTAAPG